jgi:hypothetical protein
VIYSYYHILKMTHFSPVYYFILGIAGTALLAQVPVLINYLLTVFYNLKHQDPISDTNEIDVRLDERNRKFQDSYTDTAINYNENIDPIVYNREQFNKAIQDENNEFEPQWSRRIMMECTPRGNLIMVYNLYKQSFDYYADNYIPHQLLTAAAMKYVVIYRCRDFFIDSNYVPKESPSKITLAIKALDDSKKKEKEVKNKDGEKIKGPFVRNKVSSSSTEKKPDTKTVDQNEKHINKFSYMGKIANLSILRKPKRVHETNGFNTKLLDFGNMSYEEYKNIKNAQK